MSAYVLLTILLQLAAEYARRRADPKWQLGEDAYQRAKQLYMDTRAVLATGTELTPQQTAELDANAEALFASDAANPDLNE